MTRPKKLKILFIKQKGEDYLGDSIYHGLKSLYGKNVICNENLDYMYSDYPNKSELYGKGFTLFCNLDPEIKMVDEYVSISESIKMRYYDYIIYGSFTRNQEFFELVTKYYDKNKIILIDGEDESNLNEIWKQGFHYFKRELKIKPSENVYPISFSIPKEKFVSNIKIINKTQHYGTVIPYKTETYIFDSEKKYYENYQKSWFGVTMKKAGWDCMRHYEIMANKCVPYFINLIKCPFYTLWNFPKNLILEAERMMSSGVGEDEYKRLQEEIYNYAKTNLTTEVVVKYIFAKINSKYGVLEYKTDKHPTITSEFERLCSPEEGQSVDIKEHLPTLSKYAAECYHITEMGVRSVVSTWAFLAGYPKRLVSYDIEYHPNIEKALHVAHEAGIDFDYILKDVLQTEIEETDFLFLDTFHVKSQVSSELNLHAPKVRKYIGFHDTTSFEFRGEDGSENGIWPAIQEFLDEHPEWKIKERWYNNNGVTIIERI